METLAKRIVMILVLSYTLTLIACKQADPVASDPQRSSIEHDPAGAIDNGGAIKNDFGGEGSDYRDGAPIEHEKFEYVIPREFPPMYIPSDNPLTQARIELGRFLFYDKSLSVDKSTSCGSCHAPSAAFSDFGRKVSVGFSKKIGTRNALALVNIAYQNKLIWDGRFKTLEEQAIGPIMHPLEMGNGSIRNEADENNPYGGRPTNNDTLFLFERIRGDKLASNAEKFARSNTYSKLFKAAFGDSVIKLSRIAMALSAFERTMISKSSPFDEFNNGRLNAINPSAKRGYKLFIDKDRANCISCHNGINFTDNEQRNNGLQYSDKDRGLQDFTKKASDAGLFKTPTLRNVALTAPYMHDGRLSDLRAVIEHYSKGGDNVSYKDSRIKPLNLTEQEKIDLEEFLKSLTDLNFASNPSFKDPRSW